MSRCPPGQRCRQPNKAWRWVAKEDRSSEVARLLGLAREKSRAGRATLFAAISDLFERRDSELTADERALMLEILGRLCKEVELAVRKGLAERLGRSGQAPRDLLTMLANDEAEVAREVLLRSPVLRDADLVEVVRHRTMQHRLAVAARKGIGEAVTTALVEAGEEDVIATLLENQDARLRPTVLEYLVDESNRVDRYQSPLVRRADLPPALAKRMVAWVSAALRQQIVLRYEVDQDAVDDALSGIVSDAFDEPESEETSAAQRVVDKLHGAGELSQGFALKSLRQGQVPLFEAAMAKLTGIKLPIVRRMIYEPGGEGLAIACRAIGFDRAVFQTIYHSTRQARPVLSKTVDEEVRKLVGFYDGMDPDAAKAVLRRWLRDHNYLQALIELDPSD